jgi:tRNA nucleotidyltransferase (CCA-adding enzyme)
MAAVRIDRAKIAPKAIEACKILQDHGFEAYLVGGCVRDLLLDKMPKDWDITTNAKPDEVQRIFPKTYPTGIQHGTITVSMGTTPADHFEITTYRGEGEYIDGRRPNEVYFVDGVTEDLARRDLTINAIAYDPVNDKIEDPFGGIKDLESKMIRAVGNPDERFREDGLRTMRVARFAARLGFSIDPATEAAIANNLETLAKVSKERMRDELTKTLITPRPSVGLSILYRTGALGVLGPSFHNASIPSTFDQIDRCHGSMETKMAILLLHLGRAELDKTLRELRFSNQEVKKILFLEEKLRQFSSFAANPTAHEARKFLAAVKNDAPEGYEKSLREFLAFGEAIGLQGLEELKKFLSESAISRKELNISGKDLLDINIPAGQKIKKVLDMLYEQVLEHPELNDMKS